MAPQKRSAQEAESLLTGIKAIVMDIEGTTTPISFVKKQLFPYIEKNLDTYLEKNYDDTETQKDIAALRTLATKDKEDSVSGVVEIPDGEASKEDIIKAVAENVRWQMGNDRKSTELKQLQGHILKEGYKQEQFKESLFKDVPTVLQLLKDLPVQLQLYIYSSGSVEAQKLLFEYSDAGNLVDLFTGFFDTNIGSKTDVGSYKKIQQEVGCEAGEILFLTDSPDEAKAANQAAFKTALVIRDGNAALTEEDLMNFNSIENFHELIDDEECDDDLKRFEGDDDEEDPDDDEDDDEVDEENQEEEEDA